MKAKTDLQARARELRLQGRTYNEITAELGCAKSSVSLWVRDLPTPARRVEQGKQAARARWDRELAARDAARQETKRAAAAEIGTLTERELFLIGVGLYWSEGAKDKTYDRRERVIFVNSDPGMIKVYLTWLRLLGVDPEKIHFSVTIHETADIPAAEKFWADLAGIDLADLGTTVIKRHTPTTLRKNTGESYRGCLTVRVRQSAELYRRIEGWWCGIVGAAYEADLLNRT
ncbi:hypothetical protein [Streptomyces antimicrobicus]|uniref:hypothetical protein n=1 Tax=Streptomyces antimicrobicus TaxID=2883108 RepID=UPI0027E0F8EC|nr:hypothetical protein [Streptomyces antimicrobicus]